jgi:hypothetical protein
VRTGADRAEVLTGAEVVPKGSLTMCKTVHLCTGTAAISTFSTRQHLSAPVSSLKSRAPVVLFTLNRST